MASFSSVTNFFLSGCTHLHCLSCDCRVVSLPRLRWGPNVDYLFLRNHAPHDVDKLRKACLACRRHRAYACGCAAANADADVAVAGAKNVVDGKGLQWTCMRQSS